MEGTVGSPLGSSTGEDASPINVTELLRAYYNSNDLGTSTVNTSADEEEPIGHMIHFPAAAPPTTAPPTTAPPTTAPPTTAPPTTAPPTTAPPATASHATASRIPTIGGPQDEYDLNSAGFDVGRYFQHIITKKSLDEILTLASHIGEESSRLRSDLQLKVYQNYSRFINTSDTVQALNAKVEAAHGTLSGLANCMATTETSRQKLEDCIADKAQQTEELSAIRDLLVNLREYLELPILMRQKVDKGADIDALTLWCSLRPFLKRHDDTLQLRTIRIESDKIAKSCRRHLMIKLANGPSNVSEPPSGLLNSKEAEEIAALLLRSSAVDEMHVDEATCLESRKECIGIYLKSRVRFISHALVKIREDIEANKGSDPSDCRGDPVPAEHVTGQLGADGTDGLIFTQFCSRASSEFFSSLTSMIHKAMALSNNDTAVMRMVDEAVTAVFENFIIHFVCLTTDSAKAYAMRPTLGEDAEVLSIRHLELPTNEGNSQSIGIEGKDTSARVAAQFPADIIQGVNVLRTAIRPMEEVLPDCVRKNFVAFSRRLGKFACCWRIAAAICRSVLAVANMRDKIQSIAISENDRFTQTVVASEKSGHSAGSTSIILNLMSHCERMVLLEGTTCLADCEYTLTSIFGTNGNSSREALKPLILSAISMLFDALSIYFRFVSKGKQVPTVQLSSGGKMDELRKLASEMLCDEESSESNFDLLINMPDICVQTILVERMFPLLPRHDEVDLRSTATACLAFVGLLGRFEGQGTNQLTRMCVELFDSPDRADKPAVKNSTYSALTYRLLYNAKYCLRQYIYTKASYLEERLIACTRFCATRTSAHSFDIISDDVKMSIQQIYLMDMELVSLLGNTKSRKQRTGSTKNVLAFSYDQHENSLMFGGRGISCDLWKMQRLIARPCSILPAVADVMIDPTYAVITAVFIAARNLLETVKRLRFSSTGIQQLQLNFAFLSTMLRSIVENYSDTEQTDFALDEVVMTCCQRLVDSEDDSKELDPTLAEACTTSVIRSVDDPMAVDLEKLLLNGTTIHSLCERERLNFSFVPNKEFVLQPAPETNDLVKM